MPETIYIKDSTMFLIDKPYVSDFLKKTISDNSIPVVNVSDSNDVKVKDGANILDDRTAIDIVNNNTLIYTNSENSIGWISNNLGFTELPNKIDLFKDKYKFRTLLSKIYPDFFYKKVYLNKLDNLNINLVPKPFIIKPTAGFFSMGVYKVTNNEEWINTKKKIKKEIDSIKNLYPGEVLNCNSLIIEECIDGEEYAIDAYYDSNGEPVILNILKHTFSSDSDVSDRVYISSKQIIESSIDAFWDFLKEVGNLTNVTNFPCHIELRKNTNGDLIPIEINPMRFGGWCTTADLTYYAYNFNPYLYFYNQIKPDWAELLKDKDDKIYSLIVLDNSTGIEAEYIKSFDYDKLLSEFTNPLELRKTDFKKYPVFGFMFTETLQNNFHEIDKILNSDLKEYIIYQEQEIL